MMIMMILISPVMIDVDDGDALFTDKDKDGDECEGPPKTHKRRKKSNLNRFNRQSKSLIHLIQQNQSKSSRRSILGMNPNFLQNCKSNEGNAKRKSLRNFST